MGKKCWRCSRGEQSAPGGRKGWNTCKYLNTHFPSPDDSPPPPRPRDSSSSSSFGPMILEPWSSDLDRRTAVAEPQTHNTLDDDGDDDHHHHHHHHH
eukprot:498247-Pyramimonas_sp.AAC.1